MWVIAVMVSLVFNMLPKKKSRGLFKHEHLIFALCTGNQLISSKCLTASLYHLKKKDSCYLHVKCCTLFDIISLNCTSWHAGQGYFAAVLRPEGRAEEHFLHLQPLPIPLYYLEALFQLILIILRGPSRNGGGGQKNRLRCNFYRLPLLCRAVMWNH